MQFPMVRHAAEVGWTPVPPKEALAHRGGQAGLLFRGELEGALRSFNSWLTCQGRQEIGPLGRRNRMPLT